MTISAISYHRSDTPDAVPPLAKRMKAYWQQRNVGYRLGRCHTGPYVGHWIVVVTYPDWATYAQMQDGFATDFDYQQLVTEIGQVVTCVSRELVSDFDL